MTTVSISEYLNSNPLTDQQTREFLDFAREDEHLAAVFQRIREICAIDCMDRSEQQNEELQELGLFVSNFAIKYGRNRDMSANAIGFLKLVAEKEFAKDRDWTSDC